MKIFMSQKKNIVKKKIYLKKNIQKKKKKEEVNAIGKKGMMFAEDLFSEVPNDIVPFLKLVSCPVVSATIIFSDRNGNGNRLSVSFLSPHFVFC